jgi:sec-independent protein translocase protein TatB
MSFGEMVLLAVIALVVVGPRRLPSMLRSAGQLIGRVRRMAMDIRTESGIDEILDAEGIRSEIDNFRRLAAGEIPPEDLSRNVVPDREREYPRVGCDAGGALSEDFVPYAPPPLASPADAPPALSAAPAAATSVSAPGSFAPSPVDAGIKN